MVVGDLSSFIKLGPSVQFTPVATVDSEALLADLRDLLKDISDEQLAIESEILSDI